MNSFEMNFEMNEDQDSFSALTCSELQQYLSESRNISRNQNDDFLINAIKVLDSLFGVKEAKRLYLSQILALN